MKLGALRRAFIFEGRQDLAPVKAFKCKRPTASGRELHGVCKGPSGKEQRKGTLSVANLVLSAEKWLADICRPLFLFNIPKNIPFLNFGRKRTCAVMRGQELDPLDSGLSMLSADGQSFT